MGKVMYTKKDDRGELTIIAGNITRLFPGTGKAEGKLAKASMTLKVWDPEAKEEKKTYHTANAWNSDEKPIADWLMKAAKEGDFLALMVANIKDDEPANDGTPRTQSSMLDFQRNKRWVFEDADGNQKNVLVSVVGKVVKKEDKTIIRVPVETWVEETRTTETQWIGVSFKNGIGTAAANLDVGTPICILGGKIHENTDPELGETFRNMAGFEFIRGFKNNKSKPQTESEPAAEVDPSDFAELDMSDDDLPF